MSIRMKTTAEISESALTHNYNTICAHVAKNTAGKVPEVICVIKADGYGHGVDTVSEVLGNAGCRFFAVSSEAEALELRDLEESRGRDSKILVLGYTFPENAAELARRNTELNGFCDTVSVLMRDVRDLTAADLGGEVDVMLSNPPYMRADSGFAAADGEKQIARHEEIGRASCRERV